MQRGLASRGGSTRRGDVAITIAGIGLGISLGLGVSSAMAGLNYPGVYFLAASTFSALAGTYLCLALLLLISRLPWLEREVGHDRMIMLHRKVAPYSLVLIGLHAVFSTLGHAAGSVSGAPAAFWALVTQTEWMVPATAALVLMISLGVMSYKKIRSKMKYETWWVTHLYFYLAIALAFLHQVMYGQQFVDHAWARWVWIGMYAATVSVLVVFRVADPIARSMSMNLRVHGVVRESSDTVSVWISGRRVDRFLLKGGQFFGFRFLTRDGWWQSHPYSVSAGSTRDFLRLTVKDLGDHSKSLAALKPGTRVIVEGPYGIFTADDRRTDHVVLIGGGVGAAPVRAILDDLPAHTRVDFLFRAHNNDGLVLRKELEKLAARRHDTMKLRYLVGSRRDYPITARTLQQLVPDIAYADVYVCGPDALVNAVREAAHTLGIPEERLHDEAFSFHSPDYYAFERRMQESR